MSRVDVIRKEDMMTLQKMMIDKSSALYKFGKLLTNRTSVIAVVFKVTRLIASIVILNVVMILYKSWYAENDARIDGELPTLRKFVLIFTALDLLMNVIIILLMLSIVDETVTKVYLIDYIIGTVIALKLSWSVAVLLSDPMRFEYQADGLILADTLKRMMLLFLTMNVFLPYYLFLHRVIY